MKISDQIRLINTRLASSKQVSGFLKEGSLKEGYWWDIGKTTTTIKQQEGMLSKFIKVLGPALLGALAGWHAKEVKVDLQRKRQQPQDPRYGLIKAVLKSQGLPVAFDKGAKRFKLPKGSITLQSQGRVKLQGPKVSKEVGNKELVDQLFWFTKKLSTS